jgi:hypothetical protein
MYSENMLRRLFDFPPIYTLFLGPVGADHLRPHQPSPTDPTAGWRSAEIGGSLLQKENYKFADMKTKELILREIEVFPEPYLKEVLDFVRFLKDKSSKRGIEEAILSEPVLAEEWLAPEEDKAWEDL